MFNNFNNSGSSNRLKDSNSASNFRSTNSNNIFKGEKGGNDTTQPVILDQEKDQFPQRGSITFGGTTNPTEELKPFKQELPQPSSPKIPLQFFTLKPPTKNSNKKQSPQQMPQQVSRNPPTVLVVNGFNTTGYRDIQRLVSPKPKGDREEI